MTRTFTQRWYKYGPDGAAVLDERKGNSGFMLIHGPVVEDLTIQHKRTGDVLHLPDGDVRLLYRHFSQQCYHDSFVVRDEGVITRLLARWYRWLDDHLWTIGRWEKKINPYLKSGEMLPWWSVTGVLVRTYVHPKNA